MRARSWHWLGRPAAAVLGAAVLTTACGDDEALSLPLQTIGTGPAAECTDDDVDVATEPPEWRMPNFTPWYRDGCLVRVDVITDRPGPDHCGWGGTRVIATARRIGSRFSSSADTVHFVRDPSDAYGIGLDTGFDADATLPSGAAFSGYATADEELWLVRGDTTAAYLVTTDRTERWPSGDPPLCS